MIWDEIDTELFEIVVGDYLIQLYRNEYSSRWVCKITPGLEEEWFTLKARTVRQAKRQALNEFIKRANLEKERLESGIGFTLEIMEAK